MSYAIIGFGEIGQTLARAFARNGIEVSVATTRDPESLASDAAAIGPEVTAKTFAEAPRRTPFFWLSVLNHIRMSRRRSPPGRGRPSLT